MDKRGPGRPRKHSPILFGEARRDYQHWLRTASEKECKKNSVRTTKSRLMRFEEFAGEAFDFHGLDEVMVRKFIAKRQADDVSPRTINFEITALGGLQKFLVEEAKSLPLPLVKFAKLKFKIKKKPKITVLTTADFKHLIKTASSYEFSEHGAPSYRTILVLKIAYYTGFRHQEIAHLQRRDVDLAMNTIHVSAKANWTPKTHEEREVPMQPKLRIALEGYLKTYVEKEEKSWIFPGYAGYCMTRFDREVRECFERAGLGGSERRPGLHMLRRTWATNLLIAKVDLGTVKKLGGWSSIASAERYLGSIGQNERNAIAALPDLDEDVSEETVVMKTVPKPTPTTSTGIDPTELRELVAGGMSYDAAITYLEKRRG